MWKVKCGMDRAETGSLEKVQGHRARVDGVVPPADGDSDVSANNQASNFTAWPCEMCGIRGWELGELNV